MEVGIYKKYMKNDNSLLKAELQKVPSSSSLLVRKDFGIREILMKGAGKENMKVLQFRERKIRRKERKE